MTRGLAGLAWRSVADRRLRTFLTIVGVALGVAVLLASFATSSGIDAAIDRTVHDVVGRADLRVSAFQDRGLSARTVHLLETTPGVAAAVPTVERRTYLAPTGAAPLAPPVTVLGIDPQLDSQVHDLAIVRGSVLSRPEEASALISERLAEADGYDLGSELRIQGTGTEAPEAFRIIGILAAGGPVIGAEGRSVVIPIEAATRIFRLKGVSTVDLALDDGASAPDVQRAIAAELTTEPYVLSSPRDLALSLRASTAEFQSTTALIAAVALFVAAFLIFSTLSMTVGERVREVGLLRAAGATRNQVLGFVLTGALVIGVAGAAAGVVGGALLGLAMSAWLRSVGSVQLDGVGAPFGAYVVAAVVGLLVTLSAALEPAWRASRISPVEALKARPDARPTTAARLRWLVVVFAAVAVLGLLVWPAAAGTAAIGRSLVVYAILLVAVLVSPFLLGPLGRVAGTPFGPIARFEERLARGSFLRNPSRTALTVGALAIGLAMIVALGAVAQNARLAATAWLSDVVPGDEVVTSIRPVPLDGPELEALRAVDGVARVTPAATFDVAYRGFRLDAAAVVGADLLADGRLDVLAGDRSSALTALDRGGIVLVPNSVAARFGLHLGDPMAFAVGEGRTTTLRVGAILERGLPGATGESVLVGWPDATSAFGVTGADFFAVRFDPARAALAASGVAEVATSYALQPASLDQIQGAVSDALARVFGLFDALTIVAVLVAALGIVNTLTINVVERVREIGVLRAAGMTRRQVGRMVVVEAGIVGLAGAILGALTGLVVAVAMIALAGGTLLVAGIPWTALGLCFLLGVGISMLAAWYPALVAGRLSIVRAVQFE